MLLLAHVGYTVVGGWAAQRLRLKNTVDFRLLAVMAVLPDIIDRTLFLFIIPDAQSGRLIAHTLAFQLALLAALVIIRRGFWIYGLASLMHLALDSQTLAASQALWPLLGSGLENVQIGGGEAPGAGHSFGERVLDRLEVDGSNYTSLDLIDILFEVGGLILLTAFAISTRIFERHHLLSLLLRGTASRRR